MIRVIPPTTLSNLSNGQKQAALKIFTEPLYSLVLLSPYLKEEKKKKIVILSKPPQQIVLVLTHSSKSCFFT